MTDKKTGGKNPKPAGSALTKVMNAMGTGAKKVREGATAGGKVVGRGYMAVAKSAATVLGLILVLGIGGYLMAKNLQANDLALAQALGSAKTDLQKQITEGDKALGDRIDAVGKDVKAITTHLGIGENGLDEDTPMIGPDTEALSDDAVAGEGDAAPKSDVPKVDDGEAQAAPAPENVTAAPAKKNTIVFSLANGTPAQTYFCCSKESGVVDGASFDIDLAKCGNHTHLVNVRADTGKWAGNEAGYTNTIMVSVNGAKPVALPHSVSNGNMGRNATFKLAGNKVVPVKLPNS